VRVSSLVISFTSENNCPVRVFPFSLLPSFPPPLLPLSRPIRRFAFVRPRSLFDSISILSSLPLLSLRTATITNYLQFRLSPGVRAPTRAPLKKKFPSSPRASRRAAASRRRERTRARSRVATTSRIDDRRSETYQFISRMEIARESCRDP